jgi:chloramphenicol-sensitive protein RarD
VITTVPLLMFAYGAQRLTLVTLGLLQYVGPTIQLAIGLFLFNEPLTLAHSIAFPLIWCGLALYSWASLSQRRAKPSS